MKLTPDDVINQNFSNRPMGFNKEEVRAFLEIVAAELEDLIKENEGLKKRLDEKDSQVRLMDETRFEVKEILSALKLMKNDQESGGTASKVGASLGEILETLRGLNGKINEIGPRREEFTTKEDLERFISTMQKLKEEELDKAGEEAKRIIDEARQKSEDLVKRAEADVETKKEEAALIINSAQQRAEEILREAESLVDAKREQAIHITNEARQRVEAMIAEAKSQAENKREEAVSIINEAQGKAREIIEEAENQAEKMRDEGSQIIRDAQQRAKLLVKEAEDQVEGKKEEAAQIVREAQQKASAVIRDARGEEEGIRQAILGLKKQHRLFEHRIKEVINFHLSLLGSVNDELNEDNNPDTSSQPVSSSPFSAPADSDFTAPGRSPFSAPED